MTATNELPDGATPPQPERGEARLADPRLRDLSFRDWRAILVRGGREALADNVTDIAASLSYYLFLAIPALLLLAVGVFSQTAGPGTVESMLGRLEGVVPAEALTLIDESLTRVIENRSGGVALIAVGVVLALWTASGAMNALMRGLNRVYDRDETRSFLRQRATALGMLACLVLAFGLVFVLLVLGPLLSEWVGEALELEGLLGWLWWILEWPILFLGLLGAFAAVLYLGPNVAHPRWRFLTPGAVTAIVVWLAASGLFALYVSSFGSYNKAWGSLAAVIVMLTWLWLSALALLLGAEVNAEAERSRELRQGRPAEVDLQAPAKS
ncbi:MAG TPA: YihY/virulence factor BrkB family protein [Gaiellaceae bacterium]|nr:YihY/virulence factor BrkB family protein [Gaiellaceae bacterium]